MNWKIILLILATLAISYFYLSKQIESIVLFNWRKFGKSQRREKLLDNLLEQKVLFRKISFWFYLFSLTIAFLGAIYLIYQLINTDGLNTKKISAIITLGSGTIFTIGFRSLYYKCEKDINDYLNDLD